MYANDRLMLTTLDKHKESSRNRNCNIRNKNKNKSHCSRYLILNSVVGHLDLRAASHRRVETKICLQWALRWAQSAAMIVIIALEAVKVTTKTTTTTPAQETNVAAMIVALSGSKKWHILMTSRQKQEQNWLQQQVWKCGKILHTKTKYVVIKQVEQEGEQEQKETKD